jgi:uncharacterized membrane protein
MKQKRRLKKIVEWRPISDAMMFFYILLFAGLLYGWAAFLLKEWGLIMALLLGFSVIFIIGILIDIYIRRDVYCEEVK